ncbi:hypothetical protein BJ508DRAFT_414553 [Ascobolus immersus RN42]|uniref:Fatty acid synthase subunit alpha n=1 Tax=Ascobolus immersus RN42 TaxID=1160509 RepID=A0A3N4I6Y4_ASCIM|nr:hypothetical protein BJ508DRAFT_414553 [Ascobolus immersus RN42]
MAKRTLRHKYESYDAAHSLQRQILCYTKDTNDIYYKTVHEEAPAAAANVRVKDSASQEPTVSPAAPVANRSPARVLKELEDVPLKAAHVLRTIVSQKLKKGFLEIDEQKTVKELVGGKSTLQNEIIGDLTVEFGQVPERPEDLSLEELGSLLQNGFSGKLGKYSNSQLSRMFSAKMPPGYTVSSAKQFMADEWRFGPGRQELALLLSLSAEPSKRLGDTAAVKLYWDDILSMYCNVAKIKLDDLKSFGAEGPESVGGGGMVSLTPAMLGEITKKEKALFNKQFEALAGYLGADIHGVNNMQLAAREVQAGLRERLDLWESEMGPVFENGIAPLFSPFKVRQFDSQWNWARQDALTMYYDIVFGRLRLVDREIVGRCIQLMNRANSDLLNLMDYYIKQCPAAAGENYALAKELAKQLYDNCSSALEQAPVYKDVSYPTAPKTTVDDAGVISYTEVLRSSARKFEDYVSELAASKRLNTEGTTSSTSSGKPKPILGGIAPLSSRTLVSSSKRSVRDSRRVRNKKSNTGLSLPFVHLKRKKSHGWEYSSKLSTIFLNCLETAAKSGVSFQGKSVLLTGASKGSIGGEILQGLLSGGARVVVTSSRFSKVVTEHYQSLYSLYGAKGSKLVLVPFNQGSQQDLVSLVQYIYDVKTGLGWDLDAVVPFAAISTTGSEINNLDGKCELGLRIMLTNVLRLLGLVKDQKQSRGIETRPAQVIIPLSPNHGTFGNDGLYSETKLALETLFNRWYSESWAPYLSICGAVIGWTRGTGLMVANNIIAEGLEAYGVRTFSQKEMAFNILSLLSPVMVNLAQSEPLYVDLSGNLQSIPNLKEISSSLRNALQETSEIRKAVSVETALDQSTVLGKVDTPSNMSNTIRPRANLRFEFPKVPEPSEIASLRESLQGMHDLERVVVVVGFSETGPWGNARTRWEMEAYGEFSLEGCVEMAWIMGLIKNFNGQINGRHYCGWVDSKSGDPVDERDVKSRYEKFILEHTGIRIIEPELFDGYDPSRKQLLHEVVLQEDLEPLTMSKDTASEFLREHGSNVSIVEDENGEDYQVILKKGATLLIPKAIRFDRFVAGQLPTGWDAKRFGIPEDIIAQVDPVTLYVLVCVSEALLSAGITDPYELYKYIHVSEIGNCIGSGVGGMSALRGMYKDRWSDKPVQNDVLQESFINTMSAWVNMLLLSAAGPIKTPVGACATAVEAVDTGYDLIVQGKAKLCFVGGFDDFAEEGSYEFANMKATVNCEEDAANGRSPSEMSRPTSTSRNGFVESQGCGVQILCNAKLALEMGLPIYGIVALTATAMDKIGRSVPAPGQGILSTARELRSSESRKILDIKYRRRQLNLRKAEIRKWMEAEIQLIKESLVGTDGNSADVVSELEEVQKEACRQEKEALHYWGSGFCQNRSDISPIRGALAAWSLTVDDLGVSSFHGTSTKANDKNESETIHKMMEHLGRSKGNPILGIFQKYLTGHPKGAAGAWMLNGCLQVLNSGLVPGNRNADNVDVALQKYEHILYPSRTIQTDGVRAFSLTSFGFGQKGAQVLGVHSNYVFATLASEALEAYRARVASRQKQAYKYFHQSLIQNSLFVPKTEPPYERKDESSVLLNPLARLQETGSHDLRYPVQKGRSVQVSEPSLLKLAESLVDGNGESISVGVDVEDLTAINIENEGFLDRNFTVAERKYCMKAANPNASFAGRWCAKEAVFKSLGIGSLGASYPLKDIEILPNDSGVPCVQLHGEVKQVAARLGLSIKVSISHTDNQAISIAIATR